MSDPKTAPNQPELALQRIYVKDLSFEAPSTPEAFNEAWKPDINIELNMKHKALEEGVYEIVLTVTATAKAQEKVVFIAEVKQAGIFVARNFPKEHMDLLLNSYCPSMLFPYAREVISDLVTRGSFPQLVLAPIDFNALYEQQNQQANSQAQSANESTIITER